MNLELIKFSATDGLILDGIIKKGEKQTKNILIQIHGMTSNCYKDREKIIADKVSQLDIDTLCFNNRGSEIVKYYKKENGEKLILGTAYEDVEDCYFDIVGAIKYVVELGYTNIYLQGHSLGATKIVYTYNKLLQEKSEYIKYIKSIILLSLVDIPDMFKCFTPVQYIELANEKEKNNELQAMMPFECSIHPFSVKTFLRYIKYYQNINFAKYDDDKTNFETLNNIKIPLFMRWGTNKELIKQKPEDLIKKLKNKLQNQMLDINYIENANHSYKGYETVLANEIYKFLKVEK